MLGSVPTAMSSSKPWNPNSRTKSPNPNPSVLISSSANLSFSPLSTFPPHPRLSLCIHNVGPTHFFPLKVSSSSSSSAGTAEYQEEPTTHVKFQTSLSLPGCSSSLSLLGTGYREKVFAIIGIKVYAAGLYINRSILSTLTAWKAQPAAEIQENSAIFGSIFQAPSEKSLQIVLVRDIDGKTFWAAFDDTVSPRIKAPTSVDESALSKFRSIFQDRPLKKGTFIFLTWLDPSKMQVCVSSNGIPSAVDATIESANVTSALFDVFFGNAPVSPSLKASVANGLARFLK